jgi:hypothetical protein
MPVGDPAARLVDVTVAEIAKRFEAPAQDSLRHYLGDELMAVYSITGERRATRRRALSGRRLVRLARCRRQPMTAHEFETWLGEQPMTDTPDFAAMTREEIVNCSSATTRAPSSPPLSEQPSA